MSTGTVIIFYIGILMIPSMKQIFTMSQCDIMKGDCVTEHQTRQGYCVNDCPRTPDGCEHYEGIDRFGKEQKYQCHCKHLSDCNFEKIGICKNGCLPGYEEPYCQKRKYHEFIRNDSNIYSHLFSPGNTQAMELPLHIRFRNPYRINTVEIYSNFGDSTINITYPYKMKCKLKQIKSMTICTGDINTSKLNISGTADIHQIKLYGCPPELYGKNCIKKCHCSDWKTCHQISGICESGCEDGWHGEKCDNQTYVNIAQDKNTYQTSSYGKDGTKVFHNGTCINMKIEMISDKAVDGNYDPGYEHKSCTSTENKWSPHWKVTFDKPYIISQLRIYNRNSNRDRLRGFKVYLESSLCFESKNDEHKKEVILITCNPPVNSSNVKISVERRYTMLTLCEVEVLQCRPGFYENMCMERCKLCLGFKCDQFTGHCEEGCVTGYYNVDNECKECLSGYFGIGCKYLCHCSQKCIHTNGSCPGSCEEGYDGFNCQKECEGHFGVNCNKTCHCENNRNCNRRNGSCSDRCSEGYLGDNCQQECLSGYFGIGCKYLCHCSQKCIHTNGSCPGSCEEGYDGFACQKECEGHFGVNCNKTCHCVNNKHCDKRNGSCSDGCSAGYQGYNCQQEKFSTNILVIGLVLLFLIIIIILGIAAAIWYWKRRSVAKCDNTNLKISGSRYSEDIPGDTAYFAEEIQMNESEAIYVNVASSTFMSNLQQFVSQKKQEVEPFSDEFLTLPNTSPLPHTEAITPENMKKNRYKTILPFDHSRVKLLPDEISSSDYINANFINNTRYIACQGSTQSTVIDFWRMIWQLKCNTIVMLTDIMENGKIKCIQYWPDGETTESFGTIQIKPVSTSFHSTYIHRTFIISKPSVYQNDSWTIDHFFFNKWPDHGIPQHAEYILEFRNVIKYKVGITFPLVVHCSAGVGRTGTYICIDILLNGMLIGETVDVLATIRKLREDRMYMVQKRIQLEFIYDVLVEHVLTGKYDIDVNNIAIELSRIKEIEHSTGISILEQQFKDVIRQVEQSKMTITSKEGEEVLPKCNVKTVLLNGPSCENEFLVTKTPEEDNTLDFLKIITKKGYLNIVSFMDSIENPPKYLPRRLNEYVTYGPYNLELTSVEDKGVCIHSVLNVKFDNKSSIEEFQINHFLSTIWVDGNYPSCADILKLSDILSSHQKEQFNKKMAIHCSENFHKSGLLCIIHILKAAITSQSVINIVRLVRLIKKIQPKMVADCDSYAFIWEVAECLQNEFSLYSNVLH